MLLWLAVILNFLLSLGFMIFVKDRQRRIFGIFFMILPVIGFVIYITPYVAYKFSQKHNNYDASNIKLIISDEGFAKKPELSEEMNIVAFEEALSIGSKHEKRSLLLNVLKNNMVQNAALVKSALNDSDSETSHYAASAAVEVYKKYRNNIQLMETKLKLDEDNIKTMRALLTATDDYIKSGVLTKRDQAFYYNKYILLFEKMMEKCREQLLCKDYLNQTDYLFLTKEYHKSMDTALTAKEQFGTEDSWLKFLEICYKTKNQKKFTEAFEEFKKSKLVFSNKGLEFIRFWSARCS